MLFTLFEYRSYVAMLQHFIYLFIVSSIYNLALTNTQCFFVQKTRATWKTSDRYEWRQSGCEAERDSLHHLIKNGSFQASTPS